MLAVLNTIGEKCAAFLDRTARNIKTDSLQIDELWARVGISQKRTTPADELRGNQYTYLAVTAREKFIVSYPTGANSNIVRVLTGDNPHKMVFLNIRRSSEHPNEMVDPWETPYQIEFSQQTNFIVRSAGPNKKFGDTDDIIFNSAIGIAKP